MGTADAAAAAAIGGRLAPAPTPGPGPGPAPPVPEAAAAAVPRYASRDASAALARPSREASAEATNARRVLSSSTFRRASFAARTRSRSDSGKAEGGRRGGGPCACGLLFALAGRLASMSTMPPPPPSAAADAVAAVVATIAAGTLPALDERVGAGGGAAVRATPTRSPAADAACRAAIPRCTIGCD